MKQGNSVDADVRAECINSTVDSGQASAIVLQSPRFSPGDLASMLGLPHPTAEQEKVITAPLSPTVVIAGAGSGKTETMSARVLWLVANGYVRADRVLGLTFTNKAAAELSQRIRLRLGQLAHCFPDPDRVQNLLAEPTVTTYHAYAGRLVNEHALRLGVEPATQLLTQALTWQCAQRVVRSFDGDLPNIDKAESTVVNWVLDLAGELAEHLCTTEDLADWTESFAKQVGALPRGKHLPGEPYAKVKELLKVNQARSELIPLVDRYEQAKRRSGAMDFGDQMSLAARLAHQFAEVGRSERARYSVVLLDEYQDTGHAQLVLLKSLFGNGHPVTAVGDPCQSIYGWRGASAGNLARFVEHFSRNNDLPAPTLSLSVSFRNDRRILDLANRIAAPLRNQGMDVAQLTSGPRASDGWLRCALLSTVEDEANWLADEIFQIWHDDAELRTRGNGRSIAVLARRRSAFSRIERALREKGVPVEVVGLGGLLSTPEVRDLVCTLRVLSDPTAGDAVVRLLTGARWRIGPRDLRALGLRARELVTQPEPSTMDVSGPALSTQDSNEQACLVEALDDLGSSERYSADGFRRLNALSRELSQLRQRSSQPLPDLVADVERTMRLDIEVAARPHNGSASTARMHLDRFGEVVNQFAEQSEHAALGAFLSYLAAAEAEERGLDTGPVQVDGDRVQILTVHAAKGLEWDVVAVPGLSTSVFPDRDAVRNSGWLTGASRLPYPLRGDADDLPDLEPMAADDQKELNELREDFLNRCAERGELEERRLAYVAVTRARQLLLCSGYWWDEATRPRGPGVFLTEVRTECLTGAGEIAQWCPEPIDEENPLLAEDRSQAWPVDPLNIKRSIVDEGAELVRAAFARYKARQLSIVDDSPTMTNQWSAETELLLRERAERGSSGVPDIALSAHLSVSGLVALQRNPQLLAQQIRRPMPHRPAPLARRGTAFHAWLEQRYSVQRLLDMDELPGAADETATGDEDVVALQEQFLASDWANRQPVEVEVPFEMVLAGIPVRGRIDAVFQDSQGCWEVVDWKTGSQPSNNQATEARSVQLAAYRLAWAELSGAPLEKVRAAFHYVRDNRTVRPTDLLDADGLGALLRRIPIVTAD